MDHVLNISEFVAVPPSTPSPILLTFFTISVHCVTGAPLNILLSKKISQAVYSALWNWALSSKKLQLGMYCNTRVGKKNQHKVSYPLTCLNLDQFSPFFLPQCSAFFIHRSSSLIDHVQNISEFVAVPPSFSSLYFPSQIVQPQGIRVSMVTRWSMPYMFGGHGGQDTEKTWAWYSLICSHCTYMYACSVHDVFLNWGC